MFKNIAFWGLALTVAVVSTFMALGSVYKVRNPELATGLWPTNGFAFAQQTNLDLKSAFTKNHGSFPDKFSDQTMVNAVEAFKKEPVAYRAIRMIALNEFVNNDVDDARALMRLVGHIVKRDQVTNMWLAQDYGNLGDVQSLLLNYDRTLRSSAPASAVLLPLMAQSLSKEEFIEPYFLLLLTDPPWAQAFWKAATSQSASISNAAILRAKLHEKNIDNLPYIDAAFLRQAVRTGNYDAAWQLYGKLAGRPLTRGKQILNNSDFSEPSVLPPIEWEVFSTGSVGAAIAHERKSLEISVIQGDSGVAARQFVKLAPGNYQLAVDVESSVVFNEQPLLKFVFTCAKNQSCGERNISIMIDKKNLEKRFRIETEEENYFWVNILTIPNDQIDGYDIDVRSISLRKEV